MVTTQDEPLSGTTKGKAKRCHEKSFVQRTYHIRNHTLDHPQENMTSERCSTLWITWVKLKYYNWKVPFKLSFSRRRQRVECLAESSLFHGV
ncbi:hypothetical protein CDAR_104151 [Caerostris darwini]|uniref:Uncharacterized protein n=1 Tax=Caerostris darwini TaxID=1538125 RepID=A0AAV4RWV0_9ARAC|nr:hypothetical protein CDAR_104151 [Caerostris darwini]